MTDRASAPTELSPPIHGRPWWHRPPVGVASALCVLGWLFSWALPASAASAPKSSSTHKSASAPESKGRVTFGIVPALASGEAARSNFTIAATPGGVAFDQVVALNYSTVPLSLQLYATDAIETSSGGFSLLPASIAPTGAGAWIAIPPQFATLQVPAESSKTPGHVLVPLTIHVPFTAAAGDHVGGIVVSLQTRGTNATGQNVVLDQRVGTRVFIQVSGPLSPKLGLSHLHSSYSGTLNPVGRGHVNVSYVLTNTGNVDLAVHQSVSVTGLLGSKRSVNVPRVSLLLPGASIPEQAVVAGVWPQLLAHAAVTATPIVLATGHGSPPVTATDSVWVWTIPWPLLILLLLVIVVIYLYRRRRSPHSEEPDGQTSRAEKVVEPVQRTGVPA
jgi:hypothetical protein